MIILCIFNINYILLEISGSHSNIISDSYVFHYGNKLVSRTGNKEIRHFITTNYDQKYPFATRIHHNTSHFATSLVGDVTRQSALMQKVSEGIVHIAGCSPTNDNKFLIPWNCGSKTVTSVAIFSVQIHTQLQVILHRSKTKTVFVTRSQDSTQ